MIEERPPLVCRVISEGITNDDDKEISLDEILEWRGEIIRRYDAEKDDVWNLYQECGKSVWVGRSEINVVGRPECSHTLKEVLQNQPHIIKKI